MFPKDSPQARTGARAEAILHYTLDSNRWNYRQETGPDVGRDCTLELIEDGEYRNHKIEGQIKGTESIETYRLKTGAVSFPLKTITASYAINSPVPFALFLVDNVSETVYFVELHAAVAQQKISREALETQDTVNIKLNPESTIRQAEDSLVEIAKFGVKR